MAKRTKTRQISIANEAGTFSVFFRMFSGEKKEYDFQGLASLRNILSNEKARMIHILKTKSPKSIYELSKILNRDFKAVNDDVKILEKFGFIDLVQEKTGKRNRLRPVLVVDSLNIEINI
jgi:predicted transcriptional regulator